MLNEIHALAEALKARNVLVPERHPWIQSVGKSKPMFRVFLSPAGIVKSVEEISPEARSGMCLIRRGNHFSFPVTNLTLSDDPKTIKKNAAQLGRLLEFAAELGKVFDKDNAKLLATTLLIERLKKVEPSDLLNQIMVKIKSDKEEDITVVLDIVHTEKAAYLVNDPKAAEEWNAALLACAKPEGAEKVCSLSGVSAATSSDPIGPVNLPALGKTSLYSRFGEVPCLERYGRSDRDGFLVSDASIAEARDAIQFLATGDERKNRTYAAIGKDSLLIAYLDERPELVADYVSPFRDIDEADISQYEERCSKLFQMLHAKKVSGLDHLSVLVIEKVNKGTKRVVLDEHLTVDAIRKAVQDWRDGLTNCPTVETFIPQKKGEPAKCVKNEPFSPTWFSRSFGKPWIRGGDENTKIRGLSIPEAYSLFLHGGTRAAEQAHTLLQRYVGLVKSLLYGFGKGEQGFKVMARQEALRQEALRQEALVAVSILGLLLYKQGRLKEEYMRDIYFAIGQGCKAADGLHKRYCAGVRDGDVPSQLLGNSSLTAIIRNPAKGLKMLLGDSRLRVYMGWVEQNGDGLGIGFKRQLEAVAEAISGQDLPKRLTPEQEAELMLGWLAPLPKLANSGSDKTVAQQ
jgi:hypothetical protein